MSPHTKPAQRRKPKPLPHVTQRELAERKRLATRLKALRSLRGLTQEQAAALGGVDERTVRNLEAGASGAMFHSVVALAVAYGVTLEELFES